MAFEPPQRLVRALGETAPEGDDWLERLPEAARGAVAERELTVERVQVPGGRSSLVVLVRTAGGTPAVLKLAPHRARPESERAALAHWDGRGAVQLLEPPSAGSEGVLLLERLHPDVSVRSLPEAKALLEAAGTLRRLWVEPPGGHDFETVAERTGRQARAMRAGAQADPEVAALVAAALEAREELLAAPPEHRLLHGTFRQSKVLAGDRMPWLAVGPDPVVGECAFDLARLVRDRVEDLIAQPSGATTTRRRVKRLAESLEVDRERLAGWTLFRAVESGVRARRVGRERDAELLLEFATWL
ncbi:MULTISPECIES: aminoglycoside phosphotransferase family protein [Streptomyces]|jgi:streptomycin 6-kinase|uniref:Kinase n=2 Tax=Streptomyces TaxID=1883 RepID=A0A514JN27_9ACTN|nr:MULTISPECIES: aminoglycoside phosphotransferase family protein [Streptomyces]MBA8975096.1 streptomycin 6-kinase [Streptomyces calvus]MYS27278.1 kinase [Streptomyces sp. SID7804]QDI68733.1 kinase [Streptomyces calvus]